MSCCTDRQEMQNGGVIAGGVPRIIVSAEPITSPLTSLKYAYQFKGGALGKVDFHEDGSVEYPAQATDPPDINGYERDVEKPTLFHPLWQPCMLRMFGLRGPKKNGSINVVALCNHPEAPAFGKYVTHADHCSGCPLRKEQ